MKTVIRFLALLSSVSTLAISCFKEDPVPETKAPEKIIPVKLYRYSFDLPEDKTHAILNQEGVFWEPGDMVGLYLDGIGNTDAEIDMDSSPKTVILRNATSVPVGTKVYPYYPFDEDIVSLSAVSFSIPQKQDGGIVSSMPMAGIPFTVEAGGATSSNGQVYFLNLASIIDFQVYSGDYAGETVRSITFQADGTTIAGDAILDLSAIDPSDESTLAFSGWGSKQYNQITVRQQKTVASSKEQANSIYMVLAPGTYPSGTITIETDAALYTFQYTNKALARNELKHYTMNLSSSGATRQVIKVKSTLPYSEPFTSNKGDFVIEGGKGSEWTFTSSYGAKVTGSNVSTSLVSPWIDLSSQEAVELSFVHYINSSLDTDAGMAAVYIMAEGDANWTKLDVTFPDRPASGFSNALSVTKDISSWVGKKIRISFAYNSAGASSAAWEIKNFLVDLPTPVYSLYSGALTEGDYLIVYNGKAMKNTVSSNRFSYEEVTPSDNKIEDPDASIIWHIAPSGNYWTIYNAAVNKYAAANGTKNQGQLLASGTDDKSLWTVSGTSSYEFVNKNNSAAGVNANLRNNGTYGFATYSTGTGGALSLYKLSYGSSSSGGESGSGEGGGGVVPTPSGLPGHLGCFEIPAVGTVSGYAHGSEVVGDTEWYRWNTTDSNQKIVTHTFYNDYVSPSRMMRSYTLLQDYDKKCALWVACAMNNDVFPKVVSRSEKWVYDPALPNSWQPNLSNSYPDKNGASYDRGHQLAASYRETTSAQVKMTCYFTNMTPQLSSLNQGKWQSTVETNVRDLGAATSGRDTLYVVSGPLFRGNYGTVEDKDGMPCARPSHYFQCFMKVRYNADGSVASAKGAAYLVEHVASPTVQYVTIDYVESLTDNGQGVPFDFFANVPESIQNTAEATATPLSSF